MSENEFDFNDKMATLIDAVKYGTVEDLKRNIKEINALADHCRKTGIYKRGEKEGKEFSKDMTAIECYRHMIERVATAPFVIIAQGATILMMPIIADKLNAMTEQQIFELTPETVAKAIECAAIVYAPVDKYGVNRSPEKWFFDLNLIVGRKGTCCQLMLDIQITSKGKYVIWLQPYDKSSEFITDLPDKEMTDARAKEILCDCATRFLQVVAEKGLYRKIEDGDWVWHVGKSGKVKLPVQFKPEKPIRGLRNNDVVEEGWRIIQNPFSSGLNSNEKKLLQESMEKNDGLMKDLSNL